MSEICLSVRNHYADLKKSIECFHFAERYLCEIDVFKFVASIKETMMSNVHRKWLMLAFSIEIGL